MVYNYNMKRLNIFLSMIISIIFIGCYSVERIRYDHKHNIELSDYAYRGIWNSNILKYVFDGNVFWVKLSNDDVTVAGKPKKKADYYFCIDLTISSKSKIDNIIINSCEILFDDNYFRFENDEITNTHILYSYIGNTWHNSIIFSKGITRKEYNLIKNVVKKGTIQKFVLVNMDIDYLEDNEHKNWIETTKLGIRSERTWYTPANFWGMFGGV